MIEVHCVGRPKLPRYFPPGYFDRAFWLMFALNVFGLVYCAGSCYWIAGDGRDFALFVTCVALALNIVSNLRMARTVRRHSHQWRTKGRPKCEAAILEIERISAQLAQEFAEFQNSRGNHAQTTVRIGVLSDGTGTPRATNEGCENRRDT